MKKLFTLFAAALVMLAVASCEKNEVFPDNNTEGKAITLSATIDNGGTKTSFGEKDVDTYPVLWSKGDAIAVIQTENVEIEGEETTVTKIFKFVLQGEGGTTNGVFNLVEYDECGYTSSEFDASKEIKAFYPFDGVWESGTRQSIMYTVPATQNHTIHNDNETSYSTFGNGASPMAAYADNAAAGLTFKNLFGVLKLQLKGTENVKSISLTSNLYLSNYARVSFGVNSVINMDEDDADKSVILSCGEGVALNTETATDFLICVPPGEHSFALTINSTIGGTPKTYDLSTQQTITADNIKKMAVIDLSMAYIENGVYLGDGIAIPAGGGKTIIWAPVNCGYEPADGEYKGYPYGKLYQWGRKYGQGYNSTYDATTPEISTGPVTLDVGQSESNMNVLFHNSKDWLSSENDKLWNSGTKESPVKTDYDPCPKGWRVPTEIELLNLCQNYSSCTTNAAGQQGFWFSGATSYSQEAPQVFFPAAGYHHWQANPGQNRDDVGRYWSSSPAYVPDIYVWYLDFNRGSMVTPEEVEMDYDRPGHGYSVRCVKDTP